MRQAIKLVVTASAAEYRRVVRGPPPRSFWDLLLGKYDPARPSTTNSSFPRLAAPAGAAGTELAVFPCMCIQTDPAGRLRGLRRCS
jgi:hypothetical protein